MTLSNINRKIVLIIEDEYSIRETLREALESEGYQVVTAVDGLDGMRKLTRGPRPHLVLLDLVMPIMTGTEFLKNVRADPDMARIPVLVVSATATATNTDGASAFLPKPPDLDVLLRWVERLIAEN